MPEDDYSDSDDESVGEVETSVFLGVPDGPIDSSSDLTDPEVSRIGGKPAALTSSGFPSNELSRCKICSQKMELLVQIWCPFEDSPLDRSLYVFGCAKAGCQKKDGSLRAWRAVKHNAKYAQKLQKKKENEARKKALKEREGLEAAKKAATVPANPFAVSSSSQAFGVGTQLFGANPFDNSTPEPDPPATNESESDDEVSEDEDEPSKDDVSHLGTALAQTTINDLEDAPAYTPIYLSTSAEYVPPPPKRKAINAKVDDDDDDDDRKSKGGAPWGGEGYEKALNIDEVFQRFTKRVGYEAEQCIRYDLHGVPLPFQTDAVYKKLFPVARSPNPVPTTKAAFVAQTVAPKRTYDPSSLSPCPRCQAARTFECQLMPNLLNVLNVPSLSRPTAAQSEEQRKKELERVLLGKSSGGQGSDRTGMEWGTCLVFSCEKDCCLDDTGSSAPECWREELVQVQWE